MSVNTQWVEHEDRIYSRYKKVSNHAIAGKRLDPIENKRIDWVLMSDWKNWNMETETLTFNYETDVIEIYSAAEDKVFRQLNAYLFQNGFLAPYDSARDEVDMTSALSDADISDIAGTKNTLAFKKKIKEISSKRVLQRVLDAVRLSDRPYSFISTVEDRMKEI